jgi:uncharacterized Zn-finger protein
MTEEAWEELIQTNGLTVAEMLVNELQAAGIPARVVYEGAGQALGLTVGILGTYTIVVPASRLEEAQAYLDVEDVPAAEDVVTCPYCGTDVAPDDDEWEAGVFVCPNCGHRVDIDELD